MMPGKKIYTLDDLVSFFKDVDSGIDYFAEDRKNKAELSNKYADHICERLTQVINQFLDSARRK